MGMVNRLLGCYCTQIQYPFNPHLPQVRGRLVGRATDSATRQRVRKAVVGGVKAGVVLPGTQPMQPKPFRPALMQVTKKLAPDQPGAKKLAQRFGEQLLCVRYRQDTEAGRRYTTVELVVDEGPMPIDKRTPSVVHLRVDYDERALQQAIRQQGGIWDRKLRVWRVQRDAVLSLQLQNRVLRNLPAVDTENGRD